MYMFNALRGKQNFGLNLILSSPEVKEYQSVNSVSSKTSSRSIQMKSQALGIDTSPLEVTNISPHGIWLLTTEEELFLSFEEFPWFKEARVSAILHVECPQPGHFYWPDMDIDLTLESIRHPERYPLVSKLSGEQTQ
jgi:hypothetical protein